MCIQMYLNNTRKRVEDYIEINRWIDVHVYTEKECT